MRCISEMSNESKHKYAIGIENAALDNPEVIIMIVKNGCKSCFYMGVTGTNADIENAKMVCA
jgi:hypothetical protein